MNANPAAARPPSAGAALARENRAALLPRLAFAAALGLAGAFGASAAEPPPGAPPHVGEAFAIPGLELPMAPLAAGTFTMGSPVSEIGHRADETPHRVTLTRPFWLGRTPVTQAQYEAVAGSDPAHFKGAALPVESVSWTDAMAFCRSLTQRERAAGRLPAGYAYTLPTEAQREYACRAGTGGPYAGELAAIAWYSGDSDDQPHAVGEKQPNAWGLYDMQGNVWEWCLDWYAPYSDEAATDPGGPSRGDARVYRGGAWFHSRDLCRSAYRYKLDPATRASLLGFRIALSPVATETPGVGAPDPIKP